MLILQALLLWLIVAALMVGGAMLFHRYFREESPWLGFIVPPLAVTALGNFIEHFLALPTLLPLLPVLLGATVWMALAGRFFTQTLVLPTAVFLGAFAVTFAVRCLQPDIASTSDGVSDLNMINNFLQGQTIPPPDTWMPPFRFEWYYDFQHYAASVLDRLLGVKIGAADNVSHALLNALVCLVAAACAHRFSGEKLFATLSLPFLILCSATGSAAYLILICRSTDLWLPFDLSSGIAHPPDANPIWKWLTDDLPAGLQGKSPGEILDHQTLRLQVPGFWTWRDEFHANAAGHLLTLLSVLVVAELNMARRSVWPWVLAAIMPMLAATASAWALPITTLLCWPMAGAALYLGRRPGPLPVMLWTLFAAVTLLWPAFYNATSNPQVPDVAWIDPLDHVPLDELLVQWWPIFALMLCALYVRRELTPAQLWCLIVVPVMLIGIDLVTIESRYNTIEKMWGYTWAVGLAALYPIVASRALPIFRIVVIVILANGAVSLYSFAHNALGGSWDAATLHLEGSRYLTTDDQKRRLLEVVGERKHAVFLSGKCAYCYNQSPALTVFTGNMSYIAWSWFETHASDAAEAKAREKLNNDFYAGAMPDRLEFLRTNHIEGVVIWPEDQISDNELAALQKELASDFTYVDCKGDGANNAGVFLKKS
jgi:hypothetical protein